MGMNKRYHAKPSSFSLGYNLISYDDEKLFLSVFSVPDANLLLHHCCASALLPLLFRLSITTITIPATIVKTPIAANTPPEKQEPL
jgi:hypothetical protein